MKRLLMTAAAVSSLGLAAPALAQTGGTTWYGNLGYTGINQGSPSGAHVGAVTGRVGARLSRHFGVEGEVSAGTNSGTTRDGLNAKLQSQYAGYAVGYLPVTPKAEVFARVGYGQNRMSYRGPGGYTDSFGSLNYGAGAQYFLTGKDGIRADYTRQEASGRYAPNADTASVSWVHRF